jgi:hypothetical protein
MRDRSWRECSSNQNTLSVPQWGGDGEEAACGSWKGAYLDAELSLGGHAKAKGGCLLGSGLEGCHHGPFVVSASRSDEVRRGRFGQKARAWLQYPRRFNYPGGAHSRQTRAPFLSFSASRMLPMVMVTSVSSSPIDTSLPEGRLAPQNAIFPCDRT